ncbi:MAG: N-formylglutamate amidohydrolase [Pseudomonadota bacterium]
MPDTPFTLTMPSPRSSGVIFASPHSGRDYPWSFLRTSTLDERAIRSSEDAFVDRLFDTAPRHGAPLLAARLPRAFVDLNRGADELDPSVVEGVRHIAHNPRVSSGLGVIPRVVANGRAIYRGKISLVEARTRLAEVWTPYHSTLQRLLSDAKREFGHAILIDCHSMPHEAIDAISAGGRAPDVVLGDRFGAACGPDIIDRIEAAFTRAGLRVARNAPFAGAYVTQHYGRPSKGQHVVQVEIDRALYMSERDVRPNAGFGDLRRALADVIAEVVEIGRPEQTMTLAAE